jgi:hypothetical protein
MRHNTESLTEILVGIMVVEALADWKYIDSQKGEKEVLDRVKLGFIPLACDAVAMTVKSPFWDVVDEEAPPLRTGLDMGHPWRRSCF